jgi:23S rRNA (guanosine2251-2'-O)-methyltransferase
MIIYGKQVCIYALEHFKDLIKTVYVTKISLLPKELKKRYGPKIKIVENRWAQKLSGGGNHQGILVEMDEPPAPTVEDIKSSDFILILDSITDVGNIGAIVRSAYAFGVEAVIVTGVKQINLSGIIRTSSGAGLELVPVVIPNILELVNELKQVGFRLYSADLDGENLSDANFDSKKRALILGSEGRGISKRLKSKVDKSYKIEFKREFDSLNVSAAAAIFLYRMSNGYK